MSLNLTRKQEDEICHIIGDWYLYWKDKIINNKYPNQHYLGLAKEQLKDMICGYDEDEG